MLGTRPEQHPPEKTVKAEVGQRLHALRVALVNVRRGSAPRLLAVLNCLPGRLAHGPHPMSRRSSTFSQLTPLRAMAGMLVLQCLAGGIAAAEAACAAPAVPPFDITGAAGWVHSPLSRLKRDTMYRVVQDGNDHVLRAEANGSASAFVHVQRADPAASPILRWRWRTDALIDDADNTDAKREDAPVRVIVGFDGDKSKLPEKEQRRFATAKKLSGRDVPYATLMYIWENRRPVDSIIDSAHTTRLKMIVVESGPQGVGSWRAYRRDLVKDYERAFGEKPGRIVGFAVMTDTDNTGAKAGGLYGALQLGCD